MEEQIDSSGKVTNIPLTEKTKKEIQEQYESIPEPEKPKSVKPKPTPKPRKHLFIQPGELVKMEGVICSKCGSELFTTAVCCSNPLKAQGFLRKTICEKCGIEFGQK